MADSHAFIDQDVERPYDLQYSTVSAFAYNHTFRQKIDLSASAYMPSEIDLKIELLVGLF